MLSHQTVKWNSRQILRASLDCRVCTLLNRRLETRNDEQTFWRKCFGSISGTDVAGKKFRVRPICLRAFCEYDTAETYIELVIPIIFITLIRSGEIEEFRVKL
jgi:hypothetical protein